MRVIIICFLCCFTFSIPVAAQRCLPGMKGVRISGGLADGLSFHQDKQGYYGNVSFDRYVKNGNRWLIGLEYWQKPSLYKWKRIPINAFTLDGGYNFLLFADRSKTFFTSLGFSAMAGYETVNWGQSILNDGARIGDVDNFIYGGAVNIEFESYLSDRVVLFLQVKERVLFNSSLKPFHIQVGLGLKFIM